MSADINPFTDAFNNASSSTSSSSNSQPISYSPPAASLRLISEVALSSVIVLLVCFITIFVLKRVRLRQMLMASSDVQLQHHPEGGAARNVTPVTVIVSTRQQPSIPRRGLDDEVIQNIGTFSQWTAAASLGSEEGEDEVTKECPVCLADYKAGDALKALNKCNHTFHQACIDLWLRTNDSCPICRTNLRPVQTIGEQSSSSDLSGANATLSSRSNGDGGRSYVLYIQSEGNRISLSGAEASVIATSAAPFPAVTASTTQRN